MGAFETFVNANLGIRKPLILDTGHPTGSLKAAGIVGSEYVDTDTNLLYEKTGENNSQDWTFIRKLGDSLANSESEILSKIENVQSSSSAQNFSTTFVIPQNSDTLNISYSSVGNNVTYLSEPKVFASMRFNSPPANIYAHALYNVSTQGFSIQFSDNIQENDVNLDLLIAANPDQISGADETAAIAESIMWFEESGNFLVLRENSVTAEDPAIELWELGAGDTLIPRESAFSTNARSSEYFLQTGDYLTISDSPYVYVSGLDNQSFLLFEETGSYLMLRNSTFTSEDPAVDLWEIKDSNYIVPLEQSRQSLQDDSQFFEETGQYVTII